MKLLDQHEAGIDMILNYHGVSATVVKESIEYTFTTIFNMVEHGIKLGDAELLGEKSNFYVSYKEIARSGLGDFSEGDIITSSPSKYEAQGEYKVSIIKRDSQLPGLILFVEIVDNTATNWSSVKL